MPPFTRREALAGGVAIVSPASLRSAQANSAVSLGIIGTGGRGRVDGGLIATDKRARAGALCDINPCGPQ